MKKDKKKTNWGRALKNNGYMLGLIAKACPGVLIVTFVSAVLGAINSFLLNTYLYKYALNALQEGEELRVILITLACMFAYTLAYVIYRNIAACYLELRQSKVEVYIRNLLQKKAVEVIEGEIDEMHDRVNSPS